MVRVTQGSQIRLFKKEKQNGIPKNRLRQVI